MWEYRLTWVTSKPGWWDHAWSLGTAALKRQGREPENRPDQYIVLEDRSDVGLKLRGNMSFDVDAKILHARAGGWELWEKVAFFNWNPLEAVRFAALLGERRAQSTITASGTPSQGIQDELKSLGISYVETRVEKKRIQAAARELFGGVPGFVGSSDWIAELVAIELPNRAESLLSVCLETRTPIRGVVDPFPTTKALCCGYPELLIRHQRSAL